MKNPEFLNLLISKKILEKVDTEKLLMKYNGDAYAVLKHLVGGQVARKNSLGSLWGDSLGFAYVDLTKTLFQQEAIKKLPEKFAKENKLIPIYEIGSAVTIAAVNPADTVIIKEAGRLMGIPASPVFSFEDDIEYAIEIFYKTAGNLDELLGKIADNALFKGTSKITEEQIKKLSGEQAVVEFTKGLVLLGVKERASDIHIEPGEDFVRIRFRIDGVLQERLKLDNSLLPPLASRFKIMATLDIVEKRRPQDGRITVPIHNRSIDIRLSSVPTIYGEKIVLRILGQAQVQDVPDIYNLWFSHRNLTNIKKIVENPNGVFFVTGPTGSGKTTTLYSILQYINRPGVNIMTIEDPVEYRLRGVNQIQVNHAINLDFSAGLRAFLRQDPDIILVGEVRDIETARIASQAALTGHLVLTTIHTNNALQAVTRLIDIGVEPFLVAPSIIGVMAQRLVRLICDACKEKYLLTREEADKYFITDGKIELFLYRGRGCDQCNNSGYYGRIAIHELFVINEELRGMIAQAASILEIQKYAHDHGFQPMRYDGMKKALRGLTTIDEIDRVTIAEEIL